MSGTGIVQRLPEVIWESEHACGMSFRVVRRVDNKRVFEASAKDDVDAMGNRTWHEATCTQAAQETLFKALMRELP